MLPPTRSRASVTTTLGEEAALVCLVESAWAMQRPLMPPPTTTQSTGEEPEWDCAVVLGGDAVDSSAMEQRRIWLGWVRGSFRLGEEKGRSGRKKEGGEWRKGRRRVWVGGNGMSLKTVTMAGSNGDRDRGCNGPVHCVIFNRINQLFCIKPDMIYARRRCSLAISFHTLQIWRGFDLEIKKKCFY